MAPDLDLLIVGAGMAGIAAARTAVAAGLSVDVLEARDRVGGRAHTVDLSGYPFDLGAHYLHHAGRNPLTALALARGGRFRFDLDALDTPAWLLLDGQEQPEAVRHACEAYYEACFDVLEHDEPADVPWSTLLDTDSRFYPLLRYWSAAEFGLEPEFVSALDAWSLEDLDDEWPVGDGFGALVASLADALPIRLRQPVQRIVRRKKRVEVHTPGGSETARACIVTVSTAVLEQGAILFEPGLPDAVQAALHGVPMGFAERVGFRVDRRVVEPDGPFMADVHPSFGGPLHFTFHEVGDPVVTAYLAGEHARDLARLGPEATLDYAERALVELLGTDVRDRIQDRVTSRWTTDPLTLGAYSIARPGGAADRQVLAEPFDKRIRLAGEATCLEHFGTVHGAWASGVEAVTDLLATGVVSARRSTARRS